MRLLCWLLGHHMEGGWSGVIRETPTHVTRLYTLKCSRCPKQFGPVLRVLRKEKYDAETSHQ